MAKAKSVVTKEIKKKKKNEISKGQKTENNAKTLAQYSICFFPNPFQADLTLIQDQINMAEDRKAAKNLAAREHGKEEENEWGIIYKLATLGAVMSKKDYRANAPINFIPRFFKMMDLHFIYKNYFRVDKFTRNENMLQVFHYWQRHFKNISKNSAIDWMHTAPILAAVVRSRREPGIRIGMTPKTYDCRGVLQVQNRRYLANFLRHDRGFSPMMFVVNRQSIQTSIETRILQIIYYVQKEEDFNKFKEKFIKFTKSNAKWIEMWDKMPQKPYIFPMRLDPYKSGQMWNFPQPLFNSAPFHNILSEWNQLPPGILVDYNICRVLRDTKVEICRFNPRYLPKRPVAGKEKLCEANEFMYKVVATRADEYLGALKIRRSTYGEEPPATAPFAYLGQEDDEKCEAIAYSLCHSESVESLASMSGWSTDSFASTATLTPGDSTYNWKMLSKDQCSPYRASDNAQNPKIWAYAARRNLASRISIEVDERVILARREDGRRLCGKSKNPFFKSILTKDQKIHRVRTRKEVEEHEKILKFLLENIPESEQFSKKNEAKKRLWEILLRRANCFYPDASDDRYQGLDISFSWMAAVDAQLFSDEHIEALSQLISSRDSWIMTSPLTDPRRSFRCDELIRRPDPVLKELRLLPSIWIGLLIIGYFIAIITSNWLNC